VACREKGFVSLPEEMERPAGLLLQLGGKLGLAIEQDGPYLLLKGPMRLFNLLPTREFLVGRKGRKLWGKVPGKGDVREWAAKVAFHPERPRP